MRNAGLDEAGIKIAGRNINNLRYADVPTLTVESEEKLNSLLRKMKEGNEKAVLRLNIQKTKIMTSSPINSCQVDGENVETVSGFIFLGSKINVDGDSSRGIKRCLVLGRIAMTKLGSVLKSRDITLSTKFHIVKVMFIPVVMYEYESWTIKKAAAAATAKSLQSCPTLCDPIDGSPPGSSVPGTIQARTLEWVASSFSNAESEK